MVSRRFNVLHFRDFAQFFTHLKPFFNKNIPDFVPTRASRKGARPLRPRSISRSVDRGLGEASGRGTVGLRYYGATVDWFIISKNFKLFR